MIDYYIPWNIPLKTPLNIPYMMESRKILNISKRFQSPPTSHDNQNRPEIRSPSFPPPATAGSSATASLAAPRLAPPAAQPPQALRSRRARERPDTWAGKIGQFPRKNGDLPREHGDFV